MAKSLNSFQTELTLKVGDREYTYYSLGKLGEEGKVDVDKLPFSIRVLLENVLRKEDNYAITKGDIEKVMNWKNHAGEGIAYFPSRVVLQDFTGVPCVVDFAALRDAMKEKGGDPGRINLTVPGDLVIDHSVQIDHYGIREALKLNTQKEFERNQERYSFLKWAQKNLSNFSVVPPGAGIVHQVNLEYLAQVVQERDGMLFPDSLIGTDSHTTMINGIGVFGFGVGGIEAEAVMLDQPYFMTIPEVVGMKLTGKLPEGATATDLVLTVTDILRRQGVVGKIVEFFGDGLDHLTLPDRATLSNMAPEYGATMGFFPVDARTIDYIVLTSRSHLVDRIETYCKAQKLFRHGGEEPEYTKVVELDISTITPSLAGPKRPQDRVELKNIKKHFAEILTTPIEQGGFNLSPEDLDKTSTFQLLNVNSNRFENEGGSVAADQSDTSTAQLTGKENQLKHGSLVIAAITSCTNTSNPSVMLGAGLVAKKAIEKGLSVKPWVKTSLAPGSQVVVDYLKSAGVMDYLEQAKFYLAGFGCTTCIGNSGPLKPEIAKAIEERDLVVASVLSGNRNFEGRIHSHVKANYLASPPLVVLYAFAGRIDIDLENEPVAHDKDGNPVYFKDLWPTQKEVADAMSNVSPKMFEQRYGEIYNGIDEWNSIETTESELYQWDPQSTYIKLPSFFEDLPLEVPPIKDIENARVLCLLPDSTTTDHISPAGSIPEDQPAGKYLKEHGVEKKDFNSFGSRRGNHEVMMRGTFGNIRIKNKLVSPKEGGYTIHFPEKKETTVFDAAMEYIKDGVSTIVIGGKEYGTGSSRDWAAKGTYLLGVKAVLVESYERIHRNNLVGMGVLPLQFKDGEGAKTLGLNGHETYDIKLPDDLQPNQDVDIVATREDGTKVEFKAEVRLDTKVDVDYYRNGGILQTVLRNMLKKNGS